MKVVEAKLRLETDKDFEITDDVKEKFASIEPFCQKHKVGFEAGLNDNKKMCVHFQSCHKTDKKCKEVACEFVNKLEELFGCEVKVEKLITDTFTTKK